MLVDPDASPSRSRFTVGLRLGSYGKVIQMSQREYFKAIAKLSLRQTLEIFGSTFRTLVVAALIIVLGVLIHWHQKGWPEARDEVATLVMTSAGPAFVLFVLVFLWCFFWYSPY